MKHKDKLQHFAGGFLAAFFIAHYLGAFAASTIVTGIGFGKEEYDRRHPKNHTEEVRDSLATSLGGLLGALASSFFWGVL